MEELKRLKPDVLLVEKSVARDAQDALLDFGVSLALTMKRANLERLALCSGSTVSRSSILLPSSAKPLTSISFEIRNVILSRVDSSESYGRLRKGMTIFPCL